MTAYLLSCECGKQLPVEIGQAGGQVVCSCGKQLDVPPLRRLRHLPAAAPAAGQTRAAWNARKGVIAGGLIVAVLLGASALWSRLTEPAMPKFDPQTYQRMTDEAIEKITPLQAWERWISVYTHVGRHGFGEYVHPAAATTGQEIADRRFRQIVLLSLAAVAAAVTLAAALWPQATRTRPPRASS